MITEIGADMGDTPLETRRKTWGGVCSGQNVSAGCKPVFACRGGNTYLKTAVGTAALNVSQQKDSFLAARDRRLQPRKDGSRALVAIEHPIITTIWNAFANGEVFKELGQLPAAVETDQSQDLHS